MRECGALLVKGKCGAVLNKGNKSGVCFKHLAYEMRRQAVLRLRSCLPNQTCRTCGVKLRRIHSKTGLCVPCYRASQFDGHYPKAAVLFVLHTYQYNLCWWCKHLLIAEEAIGHHIIPFTMLPDNSNANENCAAVHERCHKNIHRAYPMEVYVSVVCGSFDIA